jgi:hypothetical protein
VLSVNRQDRNRRHANASLLKGTVTAVAPATWHKGTRRMSSLPFCSPDAPDDLAGWATNNDVQWDEIARLVQRQAWNISLR